MNRINRTAALYRGEKLRKYIDPQLVNEQQRIRRWAFLGSRSSHCLDDCLSVFLFYFNNHFCVLLSRSNSLFLFLLLNITLNRIVQSICFGQRKCVERLLENRWIGVEHALFLFLLLSLSLPSASSFLSFSALSTSDKQQKNSENIVRTS